MPYWDVRGICALRSQIAGMSPLKVVESVKGMENSSRKIFCAPEKPSNHLSISSREERDREKFFTVCHAARTCKSTAPITAALVGHDDHLGIVFDHSVREHLSGGGARLAVRGGVGKRGTEAVAFVSIPIS